MRAGLPDTMIGWTCLARAVILTVAAIALALLSITAAWLTVRYGPEMALAAKESLVHGQGLVTELQRGARRSVNVSDDTDTVIKHMDRSLSQMDAVIAKYGLLANTASTTVTGLGEKAGATLAAATALEGNVGTAATSLSDRAQLSLAKMDAAMEPLPDLERAATKTITAGGDFVNNPYLNRAIKNWGDLAGSTNKTVLDFDAWAFPPPYRGPHPVRHAIGAGIKYGLKLAPGVAGGIALVKGN
jgi:hypothetical protein